MAVTESKGNGYALYNGVKLPNIDAVWTDKETYTGAIIFNHLSEGITFYSLLLLPDKESFCYENQILVATPYRYYYIEPTEMSEWELETDEGETTEWEIRVTDYPLWSNHDILNTDNTVYLAASDPIPLDGMNVIEWDGVTEGLEPFAGESLSNMWKIHSSLSEDERSGAVCAATISTLTTSEDVNIKHAADYLTWSELSSNTIKGSIFNEPLIWSHYNSEEDNGLYVLSMPVSVVYLYVSLLAYTPATTEPEEPEEPDTPPIPKVSPHLAFAIGKQLGRRIFR